MVADEPTGNVDDAAALRLMHLFLELNRMGTTVVLATHNEDLMRRFPTPCLVLHEGRLDIVHKECALAVDVLSREEGKPGEGRYVQGGIL